MSADEYAEIGLILRYARHQMGLDTVEVASAIHIRARYLTALEEGRVSELPGGAYVRGYLQAYAQFLDLDKEEILARFERIGKLQSKKTFYFPESFSKEEKPARGIIPASLAAVVIVYALWYVAAYRAPAAPRIDRAPEWLQASGEDASRCLSPHPAAYPPCHTTHIEGWGVFYPPNKVKSVLELASYYRQAKP